MVNRQLVSLSRKDFDKIVARALKNGDLTIDNRPFQMRKDIVYPVSIDKDRIFMNHCEEKDGVIEIRKCLLDISIGNHSYAQIVFRYGEDHYIKGMAIYSDDIPTGFDMVVNYGPKDPIRVMTNRCPFGIEYCRPIKQQFYGDGTKLSPINIIASEGDWKLYDSL